MIEAARISLDPLLSDFWLAGLGAILVAAFFVYIFRRGKAWLSRFVGLGILFAALLNPSYVEEEREPLPSVAALVLDRSDSMRFGDRTPLSEAAFEQIRDQIEANPAFELRVLEADTDNNGTRLVGALEGLLADVPRDRIAGSIFVTDGQIHDIPTDGSRLSALGPIHGVITGDASAGDRRLVLVDAPEFGIVGETAEFTIRIEDPDGGRVAVTYTLNGGRPTTLRIPAGEDTNISIPVERRGNNIAVFETPEGRSELTLSNNRTAGEFSGVRDGLRVLLVTGRPNSAGRVWRDLLKSDPSVDLVHFTILRPPYKQDITPLEEMALIAFPTQELFEEKLTSFDLIIFDQYERRGVITMAYLADVARYVDEGGALLIVAGEVFAGPGSLARTPLAGVLPALPTGDIRTGRTVPQLSDAGARHTITEGLNAENWGPWLRFVEARSDTGDVLLTSPEGLPLLAVDRVGEGRVGQLLSDQIWLWARGYEGGGPFSELMRRMVHWLMKEPELDERQLSLTAQGDTVRAELRTLADSTGPLFIETPDGAFLEPEWDQSGPGQFHAEIPVDQLGLYKARTGGLEAVALNGPANPLELSALSTTEDLLAPLARQSGGGMYSVEASGDVPDIRGVSRRADASGENWLGLRERAAYAVRNSTSLPLLPGWLAMVLITGLILYAWRREGR